MANRARDLPASLGSTFVAIAILVIFGAMLAGCYSQPPGADLYLMIR